jgi:DNA polymerase-1
VRHRQEADLVREVPLADATRYAAEDAEVTWRLHQLFAQRLSDEGGTRIYQRVDRPLVPVVAGMERAGIRVDREQLATLSTRFAAEISRLEAVIHEKAGGPFTIGSPKQLGEVLFDKLGYKGGKKGKSGQYSTDQSVLETLAGQGAEVATLVLEWRQLSKLKSTYTDALQAAINPDTGRVHTSYSLVGAQTGRLSSNDPNLQNIPIRTEIGRQIREAFVAEPGHVLLSADYSQIELRLAAHMADVGPLRRRSNRARTSTRAPRRSCSAKSPATRAAAPRRSTSPSSMASAAGAWRASGHQRRRGAGDDRPLFRAVPRHPALYPRHARERAGARLFGNAVRPQDVVPAHRLGHAGRAAGQRTRRDQRADPGHQRRHHQARHGPHGAGTGEAGLPRVKMLLQVHDELVFELPEEDVAAATPVIRAVMAEAAQPAITLSVPLGVEIGTGPSWGPRTDKEETGRPCPGPLVRCHVHWRWRCPEIMG